MRRRYSDPEKAENQKAEMEEIKKVGQTAYRAFNQYGEIYREVTPWLYGGEINRLA